MSERISPYYEKLGQGHADLVRCQECKRLQAVVDILGKGGCTKCGHRKMTEVRNLSLWEWFKIRFRLLNFPHRKEFLKEFGLVK